MAAKDKFHQQIKQAIENDGWKVTHDPLEVRYGTELMKIDMRAEKIIGAERDGQQIAIEIKSFTSASRIYAFHNALGQFMNYRRALKKSKEHKNRVLFLTVTKYIYDIFFKKSAVVQDAIAEDGLKVIVIDIVKLKIVKWIP